VPRADTQLVTAEQFDNAVDEYSEALSTLAGFLPPHSRQLSELNMLIALALDFVPDATARAVEHAEKAKAVLALKVAQLEQLENPSDLDTKELGQIVELIGDVDMKVGAPPTHSPWLKTVAGNRRLTRALRITD